MWKVHPISLLYHVFCHLSRIACACGVLSSAIATRMKIIVALIPGLAEWCGWSHTVSLWKILEKNDINAHYWWMMMPTQEAKCVLGKKFVWFNAVGGFLSICNAHYCLLSLKGPRYFWNFVSKRNDASAYMLDTVTQHLRKKLLQRIAFRFSTPCGRKPPG